MCNYLQIQHLVAFHLEWAYFWWHPSYIIARVKSCSHWGSYFKPFSWIGYLELPKANKNPGFSVQKGEPITNIRFLSRNFENGRWTCIQLQLPALIRSSKRSTSVTFWTPSRAAWRWNTHRVEASTAAMISSAPSWHGSSSRSLGGDLWIWNCIQTYAPNKRE